MKKGWTYKKLGEVAKVQNGFAFDSKLFNETGKGTPLIRIRDIKRGESYTFTTEECDSDYFIENGDLLIGMDGDFNVCRWDGGHAFLNQRVCHVIPSASILNGFLFYLLPFPLQLINDNTSYSTVKHLSSKQVNAITIPVPPLSEQQRIVSRLDAAFAHIDELKANAEKQLSEARALFQKALEKAMEPKEGWEEKKLGEICDIYGRIGFRGYTTKDLVQSSDDGAISLSPSNIQDGVMDYSKLTYISWLKYEESPEIKIFDGDILLVKTGSSYGKSALVENLPHEATINPQSVVLKNFRIYNKFFAYQLRTNFVRNEFDKFVSGTAIPTFSQAKLSTVSIYYPSNIEQRRIVARLDSLSAHVRELEEINKKLIAECDALKQALLRKVFE